GKYRRRSRRSDPRHWRRLRADSFLRRAAAGLARFNFFHLVPPRDQYSRRVGSRSHWRRWYWLPDEHELSHVPVSRSGGHRAGSDRARDAGRLPELAPEKSRRLARISALPAASG